jgi:acetyl esterase/lipase
VAFQGSVGYSALMATAVLGLMVAALQRPWTLYREISYGPDPEQVMDILVPRTAKVSPTIILLHGGGFIAGDKLDLAEVARQLARQGFTVANVNYRLATQAKNQYPTAVDDVQTAVAFLRDHGAQYKVDGRRMVAFGTSAGANLAIELGLAGQVQAVIDFYGPTNFMDQRFLDDFYNGEQNNAIALTYLGASLMDDSPLYYDASPLDMVSAHMPPTMIFHGARDNVVPLGQSLDFHKRLQQLGVTSRLQIEKNLGHGFLTVHGRSPQPYLNECGQFVHDVMPDAKM